MPAYVLIEDDIKKKIKDNLKVRQRTFFHMTFVRFWYYQQNKKHNICLLKLSINASWYQI